MSKRDKLTDMFSQIDKEGSGTINRKDFENAPMEFLAELMGHMEADNVIELFEMLDADDSGTVDINEFVNELTNDKSLDSIMIRRQLVHLQHFSRRAHRSEERLAALLERLEERLSAFEK